MPVTRTYTIADKDNYISKNVESLVIGTRLPFDVFIKDTAGIRHVFNKGMIYTKDERDILKERGIAEFLVRTDDVPYLEKYMSGARKRVIESDDDMMLFREYDAEKEQYYQINRSLLIKDEHIFFNLYLRRKYNLMILAEASEKQPSVISESLLNVTDDILIKKTDIHLYDEYLKKVMGKFAKPGVKSSVELQVMKENSKLLIRDLLDNPRSGEKIKETQDTVNVIVDRVLEDSDTVFDLLDISHNDYYTYTHSVNVAVMSIGLAERSGLGREETVKLGVGAMLHDIGKSAIPHEILNKQGRLNATEFEIMKTHVVEGEKILRQHPDFPGAAFPAVTQHHEKLTGKGYPSGLVGGAISLFGRITSIVDCYDALTTNRPYKTAYTPYAALLNLARDKKDYDCNILREFIEMLGKVK